MQTTNKARKASTVADPLIAIPVDSDKQLYQCRHCLTVYDETCGDQLQNIAPNTRFEDIETYICPTCDAPKQDFVLLAGVLV